VPLKDLLTKNIDDRV
jgi:hypothetical protein